MLLTLFQNLCMPNPPIIAEKSKIAKAFNRAATSYSNAASLQRGIGYKLLQFARGYLNTPTRVVDLGSGDSYFSKILANKFPKTPIFSLDLAYVMLNYNLMQSQFPKIKRICTDFDCLPLGDHSIDLIFSSMSMQWSLNLNDTLAESYRILRPDGVLLLAMPCQGTLLELQVSMKTVDPSCQVNYFLPAGSIESELRQVGFALCTKHQQSMQHYYHQFINILYNFRATGTNCIKFNNSNPNLSKRYITRISTAYETYRNHQDQLPVSYEISYFIAKKPT